MAEFIAEQKRLQLYEQCNRRSKTDSRQSKGKFKAGNRKC